MAIALTCNADGTERLPPLFVGKSKKPRGFKKDMAVGIGAELHEQREDVDVARNLLKVAQGCRHQVPTAASEGSYDPG